MKNEEYTEKTLIFNPGGFILKAIFSIVFTIGVGSYISDGMAESGGILYVIGGYAVLFVASWFMASLFGFCVRTTGNYLIGIILMFVLLSVWTGGTQWLLTKNKLAGSIVELIFIVALIWLPINDIRKAILYYKNTI